MRRLEIEVPDWLACGLEALAQCADVECGPEGAAVTCIAAALSAMGQVDSYFVRGNPDGPFAMWLERHAVELHCLHSDEPLLYVEDVLDGRD